MKKAVLSGDVINSQLAPSNEWLVALKTTLNRFGQEPSDWEVYRGDSFQLVVDPDQALRAALIIKLSMRMYDPLDARVAIGIGAVKYRMDKVTESNGESFVLSGQLFDRLKKRTLALHVEQEPFNSLMNGLLDFMTFLMQGWGNATVLAVKTSLENPGTSQKEMAKLLGISQGNVSEAYARAGYHHLLTAMHLFEKHIHSP